MVAGPALERLKLGAERYRPGGANLARAALRWEASEHWALDLSRSFRLSGPAAALWTVGAAYTFAR